MPNKKPMIILATNNSFRQQVISDALNEDYNVILKTTGSEVIELFDVIQAKVQIVIIDNQFQDINCVELLKRLKEKAVNTEFVIIAEKNNLQETLACFKEGALDYISGDVEDIDILEVVNKGMKNINYLNKIQETAQRLFLNQIDSDSFPSSITKLIKAKRVAGEILEFEDIILEGLSNNSNEFKQIINDQLIKPIKKETKPKSILIIEDDVDACENLNEVLSDKYTIYIANTAKEGCALLEKNPEISVILLDVYLPDGNGVKLIPDLKKTNQEASIIIMTAYKESEIARDALKLGAEDYFNKPLIMMDVLSTIAKVIQVRYFKIEWPKIEKIIVETNILYKVKLKLLTQCFENKSRLNQKIVMKDVYQFFPELIELNIKNQVEVPSDILETGVMFFVDELKEKIKQLPQDH